MKYLVILAIVAPITAELLNGSTPLSELAHPLVWLFVFAPYSLLLIWLAYLNSKLPRQNGAIFLLPVAGIVIEGLLTRSFFDPSFPDLTQLAGVGYFAGVQWPWTLSLIASHLMTSFLAPLAIAQVITKGGHTISKRAATISACLLGLIVILGFVVGGRVPVAHLVLCVAVIVGCIVLSKKIALHQSGSKSWSSFLMFAIGLVIAPLNWLTSFFIAYKPVSLIIPLQLLFLVAYGWFIWAQWFNKDATPAKRIWFIVGYYLPYILLGLPYVSLIAIH